MSTTVNVSNSVRSYVRPAILNGVLGLVYQANELHKSHNNNTMSEALLEFLDSMKAAISFDPSAPVQEKAKVSVLSAPPVDQDPEDEQEDEGEILFDSREEAIEALGLPETKELANKLKAKEVLKVTYGVGNDDPLSYLNMPAKEVAEGLSKKDLLSLIYGG